MLWKAVVVALCAARVQAQCPACILTLDTLVQNNLGGLGPDGGPSEMRFGNACTVQGQALDLVVVVISQSYQTRPQNINDADRNGLFGRTGRITVGLGSGVTLRFALAIQGTSQYFRVPSLVITIMDVDIPVSQHFESVVAFFPATAPINDVRAADTNLLRESIVGGLRYNSTDRTFIASAPNPTDPLDLTSRQQRNAVSFSYIDVDAVEFSFEAVGPLNTAQSLGFQFAGLSSLNPPCPTPAPTPPPTPLPTPQPTPSPTPQPTPLPTPEPTRQPTQEPTAVPTQIVGPTNTCRPRRRARACPLKRRCTTEPQSQVLAESKASQQKEFDGWDLRNQNQEVHQQRRSSAVPDT